MDSRFFPCGEMEGDIDRDTERECDAFLNGDFGCLPLEVIGPLEPWLGDNRGGGGGGGDAVLFPFCFALPGDIGESLAKGGGEMLLCIRF